MCPQQKWGQRSSWGHLGSLTFQLKFMKNGHCIHILWCICMGLGHNDAWVESHMWPRQKWGQGSFGVIDLLVKIYEKWSLYPHTLMYLHGTWTQWYLGRVGDGESRWDSWFENRLLKISTNKALKNHFLPKISIFWAKNWHFHVKVDMGTKISNTSETNKLGLNLKNESWKSIYFRDSKVKIKIVQFFVHKISGYVNETFLSQKWRKMLRKENTPCVQ